MAFFEWTEELETGVGRMDADHHRLVDLLNRLFEAMMALKGRAVRDKVILELIDYTRTHFAAEEEFMRKHDYPEYMGHKRKHDAFALKVHGIEEQIRAGQDIPVSEVSRLMREWLRDHILYTDKQLGSFLRARGQV